MIVPLFFNIIILNIFQFPPYFTILHLQYAQFFQNKLIKEADYDTFEVVLLTSPEGYKLPYGKDKNQYYEYGRPLSEAEALYEVNRPL